MGKLDRALERDDRNEARGMHSDSRETCHSCKFWADHAHDTWSGRRISLDEYARRKATR